LTLATTSNSTSYTVSPSSASSYPISFYFLANADIRAIRRSTDAQPVETTLVEGTHYALSGAGSPSGGTLTPASSTVFSSSNETLVIKRIVPLTQQIDIPIAGALSSASLEEGLDRAVMQAQQLSEKFARAPLLPETSPTAGIALPEPQANQFLAWNSAGTNLANVSVVGSTAVVVSSFMQTLLDDADAPTARTTLGLGTAAVKNTGVAAGDVPTGADLANSFANLPKRVRIAARLALYNLTS
jgi:hypothetical protein